MFYNHLHKLNSLINYINHLPKIKELKLFHIILKIQNIMYIQNLEMKSLTCYIINQKVISKLDGHNIHNKLIKHY